MREQARRAAETSREKNKPSRPIYEKLDSPDDTWFARLMRAVEERRFDQVSRGGLSLSCYAWESCENSWQAIDKGVQMMPNKQAKTELFHPLRTRRHHPDRSRRVPHHLDA